MHSGIVRAPSDIIRGRAAVVVSPARNSPSEVPATGMKKAAELPHPTASTLSSGSNGDDDALLKATAASISALPRVESVSSSFNTVASPLMSRGTSMLGTTVNLGGSGFLSSSRNVLGLNSSASHPLWSLPHALSRRQPSWAQHHASTIGSSDSSSKVSPQSPPRREGSDEREMTSRPLTPTGVVRIDDSSNDSAAPLLPLGGDGANIDETVPIDETEAAPLTSHQHTLITEEAAIPESTEQRVEISRSPAPLQQQLQQMDVEGKLCDAEYELEDAEVHDILIQIPSVVYGEKSKSASPPPLEPMHCPPTANTARWLCHLCGGDALSPLELKLHWIVCGPKTEAYISALSEHPLCSVLNFPSHSQSRRISEASSGELFGNCGWTPEDMCVFNLESHRIFEDKQCACRGCGHTFPFHGMVMHLERDCPRHLKSFEECPLVAPRNLTQSERRRESEPTQHRCELEDQAAQLQRLVLGRFEWSKQPSTGRCSRGLPTSRSRDQPQPSPSLSRPGKGATQSSSPNWRR